MYDGSESAGYGGGYGARGGGRYGGGGSSGGSYGGSGCDGGGRGYGRDNSSDYGRKSGSGYGGSGSQRGGRGGGYGGRGGGGGYQGGDRGGGGRGGSGREGDWRCPNASCGNLNFARRTECNKCGVPSPAVAGDRGGSGVDDSNGGSSGGYGSDRVGRNYGGRDGGGRDGSHGRSQGRGDGNYGQAHPPAPTYVGPGGNYPPPSNPYGGSPAYCSDNAVPPPAHYGGAPQSYPPSYAAPPGGYGGDAVGDIRGTVGRGGPTGGFGGGPRHGGGGYGRNVSAAAEAPANVKQCDENCTDDCDNSRIYMSNLPPDVTIEELRELFGGIGTVARIKQKRGFKDQWPYNIRIYTDENGKNKGDACLAYEDPGAAHSAGGFFNEYDLRGYKISVVMAEKSAPRAPPHGHGGSGYGGGNRQRDYRDSGGPDRHHGGGNRSRPY